MLIIEISAIFLALIVGFTAGACYAIVRLIDPDAPVADDAAPHQQPPAAREDGGEG